MPLIKWVTQPSRLFASTTHFGFFRHPSSSIPAHTFQAPSLSFNIKQLQSISLRSYPLKMKETSSKDDYEFFPPQTFVLIGKNGTGKSSTGNSILGTSIFRSERSSSVVTVTCELQSTKLEINGRMINVIDTPGMFGSCGDIESTAKEMINCMEMAGDGVHAFLFVFSIRNRFSKEEEAAISSLQKVFGRLIYDYMILVFTGGDELEMDGETLEDFLHDSPEKLKEIVNLCEDRCVLLDNKTEDQTKRFEQLEKLLSFVDMVSRKNDGKLYKNEILIELKIEPEMEEATLSLQRQIAEERDARLKAEEFTKVINEKSYKLSVVPTSEHVELPGWRRKVLSKLSALAANVSSCAIL